MDTYKYLTLVFVLHMFLILTPMADGTVSWQTELEKAKQNGLIQAMSANAQTYSDVDSLQTPQNTNTQTEGSGGWSFANILASIMAFFGIIFGGIGHGFGLVLEGASSSGMAGVFFFSFVIFYALIMAYGLYKLINFLKNKDAQ